MMSKFLKISLLLIFIAFASYPVFQWYKAGCAFHSNKAIDLKGKVALVTGANAGLGFETAKELVRLGCHVILGCRSKSRCEAARAKIVSTLTNATHAIQAQMTLLTLDLASLKSVREAAARVKSEVKRLDYLILNAGLVLYQGEVRRTVEGHELHFGVNHLGHFLLTKILLPFMKSTRQVNSEPLRVISISSMAHYVFSDRINLVQPGYVFNQTDYSPFRAYAQSKLANVLHMRQLAQREIAATPSGRAEDAEVIAVSGHPGGVATEIFEDLPFYNVLNILIGLFAKTPWEGAQTQLTCALADVEYMRAYNGEYFHECEPRATTVHAHSLADARALWDLSEKLVADFV